MAAHILALLASRGFLSREGEEYHYAPESSELDAQPTSARTTARRSPSQAPDLTEGGFARLTTSFHAMCRKNASM
jgi:hypothetical protein